MNNIYQDIMEPWHSKFADGQAQEPTLKLAEFVFGIPGTVGRNAA